MRHKITYHFGLSVEISSVVKLDPDKMADVLKAALSHNLRSQHKEVPTWCVVDQEDCHSKECYISATVGEVLSHFSVSE